MNVYKSDIVQRSTVYKLSSILFLLKFFQWFCRRKFSNVINLFSEFGFYLPVENDLALNLNELKSPLPINALCQASLKFAQWFWKEYENVNILH